jgi:hypothetical protein
MAATGSVPRPTPDQLLKFHQLPGGFRRRAKALGSIYEGRLCGLEKIDL